LFAHLFKGCTINSALEVFLNDVRHINPRFACLFYFKNQGGIASFEQMDKIDKKILAEMFG